MAALLVSAGCASQASEPEGRGPGLEEATSYTPEAWDRMLRHHERELVSCMRGRGFKFWSEASWSVLTLSPHGLFQRSTPAAELEHLDDYAYGVTQRIPVLRAELANVGQMGNENYYKSLPPQRQHDYELALFGDGTTRGCSQTDDDVVLDLGLPEGGDLGEAFGDALEEAEDSGTYRTWEAEVVSCLEAEGVEVEDGDLRKLAKPFLVRLLDLAGVDYEVDDDGNIHYDVSATQLAKIPDSRVRELRDDEMAAAHQEAQCRRSAGDGAQRALDAASAPLVEQFPDEVERLDTAMTWFRDNR